MQSTTDGENSNNNISYGIYQQQQSKSKVSQQNSYEKSLNHYQDLHQKSTTTVSVNRLASATNDGQINLYHQLQNQQHQIYGCSSAEANYELTQLHYNHNSVATGSRPNGPNLVNKQLVLPFVLPSFPNKSQDGITHLIKPSEYLKSISDKRSCPSSAL